jgi:hypothetical protein
MTESTEELSQRIERQQGEVYLWALELAKGSVTNFSAMPLDQQGRILAVIRRKLVQPNHPTHLSAGH